MEKFCIVTIGNISNKTVLKINKALGNENELIEVPFIYAESNNDWVSWKKKGGDIFNGIGVGAAGCLLGHRLAWELITQSKYKFAMILESDAVLTKYGEQNLKFVAERFNILDFNILHLGTHVKITNVFSLKNLSSLSPRIIAKEIWERVYLRFKNPKFAEMQFPFSTHAYLIKKDAAKFLCNQEISFMAPVDVILNSYSQVRGNKILRCRTPLIIQNEEQLSQVKRLGR